MRHHSLAPRATRVRTHPGIDSSVGTDANGLGAALLASDANGLDAALLAGDANGLGAALLASDANGLDAALLASDANGLDATLLATACVNATRVIAAFTAALSTARLLGHGLGWTKGDQGKQDRKCRHETSHSTLLFHLHSQAVRPTRPVAETASRWPAPK
jgi:hypothetical protein